MKERTGEKVPEALNTSAFSPPDLSPCGRQEPGAETAKFRDVEGIESAAGVYRVLHAEAGSSHDLRASDSRPVAVSDESARERPSRRCEAFQNGRGERGTLDRAAGMTATGSDTPRGESVDGVSGYEQVGRFLLSEELAERREDIAEQLEALEYHATEGHPIQRTQVEALLASIEELRETVQVLAIAGTEQAQEAVAES